MAGGGGRGPRRAALRLGARLRARARRAGAAARGARGRVRGLDPRAALVSEDEVGPSEGEGAVGEADSGLASHEPGHEPQRTPRFTEAVAGAEAPGASAEGEQSSDSKDSTSVDSGPDHGPAAPAPTPAPAPRPPAFTQILALARRELGAFFGRPAAWVFVAAFLVAGAVLGLRGYFTRNVADLRDYFAGLRYAFVLLAPAAAMRLWAEEKRARTLELLFSLPLSPTQAVLGKYLAGLAVVALALLLGAWLPLTLSPFSAFDPGQVLAGYLGAFLLAATFLALGMLGSALSSSQEVAFLVGALACLLLNLLGDPLLIERAALYLPRSWVLAGAGFAVGPHYESLARGLLETRSLAYFGGVTTFALFLNVLLVERRVHGKREAWLAAGLALVALVLWIDLGGQRALNRRLDLTRGGLNSLSPATRRLVSEVKGELLVRAYLSQTRLPEATQPAIRSVLDLLEALDAEGAERVRLEVIDP
ncbi:MAG TPA: hypothetical protein DEA08_07040, partial [Planctomycetes bacterium]|nr:hypothetical protein [Planctomycetota bacterium]